MSTSFPSASPTSQAESVIFFIHNLFQIITVICCSRFKRHIGRVYQSLQYSSEHHQHFITLFSCLLFLF
ncbi:hypothetical protein NC651_011305 [Populus alba x Populus x berolinensis]|nr:hypothetical protein NC651_011305 [Populus alba x Populus x berolinensis]